jgi:hypothetical protein
VPITDRSTLEDVCYEVCTALYNAGTTVVLTGGSAATVYAPESYQSRDADFIITLYGSEAGLVLVELGYEVRGGVYHHRFNKFTLEFPRGPLQIADEVITRWKTLHRGAQLLHILSPTDCVRDRLLWFYTENDRSALSAAVGVASRERVDLEAIRDWSAAMGNTAEFTIFRQRLR